MDKKQFRILAGLPVIEAQEDLSNPKVEGAINSELNKILTKHFGKNFDLDVDNAKAEVMAAMRDAFAAGYAHRQNER